MDLIIYSKKGWGCTNSAKTTYEAGYNEVDNMITKTLMISAEDFLIVYGHIEKGDVVSCIISPDYNGEYEVLSVIRKKVSLLKVGQLKQTESQIIKTIKNGRSTR